MSIVVRACDSYLSIGNGGWLDLFRGFIFLASICPACFGRIRLAIIGRRLTCRFLLYLISPRPGYACHWSIFRTVLSLLVVSAHPPH